MWQKVGHQLVVDPCVEDFRQDRQETDWSVVCRESSVFDLVKFDYCGEFECVWVVVLFDGSVVEFGLYLFEAVVEVAHDSRLDLECVAGVVWVEAFEEFADFFFYKFVQVVG